MKLEIHKQLEEKMNGTIDALKFEFGFPGSGTSGTDRKRSD